MDRSSAVVSSRVILAVLGALLLTPGPLGAQVPFDLLITGGRVLDGTGNPWFPADIGVRGGRIVAVGRLAGSPAERVIDATGQIVAPGFIDIHSHADDGAGPRGGFRDRDPKRRAAPNLVTQGVTTVVVNQDGRSPWPIGDQRALLERTGIGPNALLMVGHGTVRGRVMGADFRRPSTDDEVTRMRALVGEALAAGAWGLSAGLEYVPGRWSTTDEVVALMEEVARVGGVYISHERAEGQDPMWYWPSADPPGPPTLLDAVRETIEIGERTGGRVVASHLKAKGANYWGSSRAAIELIARARDRGVDVWADQYPYTTTGSDGSTVLIPDWVTDSVPIQNGRRDFGAALTRALADTAVARRVRRDIAHEINRRGGATNVVIFDYPDSTVVGKSVAEFAAARKLSPVEAAIVLQLEGHPNRPGGGRMRGFSLDEVDLDLIAAQPWVATASDAGIALPSDGASTHARYYGTFPRKIRRYALERGVTSVEDAVRSMTTLPARIMGIRDRGEIREGNWADLVIFDLDRIADRATFFEPHQYPAGISHVVVNGEFVVDAGVVTGALPGRVLPRP